MSTAPKRLPLSYKVAPLHPRESERIRALYDLAVLDTPPSARFDRITTLAADIFDVPTALISLVDVTRQWFLSRCALDPTETDRDVAFCAHAILEDDPVLVVEDARKDPRFQENPLVVNEPHVRFYAGAVINDNDNLPLGTLCLIGYEPREFTEDDRRRLIQLASLVQAELLPTSDSMLERTQSQLIAQVDPISKARWRDAFADVVDTNLRQEGNRNTKFLSLSIANLAYINDVFGRWVGDEVLAQVCRRLGEALRSFGHVDLGRLGGSELAALVTDCASDLEIEDVERSVVEALAPPIATRSGELSPRIRIGLSNCDAEGQSHLAAELERCRVALRATSAQGRIVSSVFSKERLHAHSRHTRIVLDLPMAIDSGDLHLVYQPKVHANDCTLHGFECLLRWEHPAFGSVSPLEIIGAAQELSLTEKLDRWVINAALTQMAQWRQEGLRYGSVAANIAGSTLLTGNFIDWLDDVLTKSEIPADHLGLEIVESSIFEDFAMIVNAMSAVKELGISFSLDDFGTGHSSLKYLKNLPVDILKLDRAFVRNIVDNQSDAALCAGIVGIARDLGLTVVAEGVETEQQYLILRAYRCALLQGYYFSKPITVSETTRLLETNSLSLPKFHSGLSNDSLSGL